MDGAREIITRVKEIAEYLDNKEFNCRSCGCVNSLEELVVQQMTTKAGKVQYKGICHPCGAFIEWMPDRKVDRVWWGGEMTEIASLETGLLIWMINKEVGSVNTRKFIQKALMARVDVHEVPDITNTKAEEALLKVQLEMKAEILEKSNLIKKTQDKIVAEFATLGAIDMEHHEKNIITWRKRVAHLKEKL